MKKYIFCGNDQSVKIMSSSKFDVVNSDSREGIVEIDENVSLNQKILKISEDANIKLAFIFNEGQQCGISTYSSFVFDELKTKVSDSKIFSEYSTNPKENTEDILYCWKRGESLENLISELKTYDPNVILIQHEWGIYPNAGYFMSFITELKRLNIPVAVVLHSVYDHLDKLIPLSILDNVIVHSESAKELLQTLKFKGNITVIAHGCPDISTQEEIYNIFQTPYLIFGYGFGFKYKGIEMAIDAIKYLKESDPKFKNMLYIYACSESENNKGIHENYYSILYNKVKEAGLQNNILLLKGFLEPEMLDIYLRTVKMVIFPYVVEQTGVRGSSGALKIAMSYNIPVIASKSHLFDDVEGHIIRVEDHLSLAREIDKLFSNNNYKEQTIAAAHAYIKDNTWPKATDRYLEILKTIKT